MLASTSCKDNTTHFIFSSNGIIHPAFFWGLWGKSNDVIFNVQVKYRVNLLPSERFKIRVIKNIIGMTLVEKMAIMMQSSRGRGVYVVLYHINTGKRL